MQIALEVVLIFIAFLSIIPVISMFRNRNDRKYRCLTALIYSTFIWTILIFIERLSSNLFLVYYAHMLGFPLRLLFASLMLCTVYQYTEKKFPTLITGILGILVLVDLMIAITNSYSLWFLDIQHNAISSMNDLYVSEQGPLFIVHLIISYIVAIVSIAVLFIFLAQKKGIRQYKEVTRMMAISVFVVLLFNMLQLFVIETNINLTYISLVIVAYSLYDVIYRKDMIFNLRTSGRGEILANMREMYILTDANHQIIEISPLLLEKYDLNLDLVIGQPFETVAQLISNQAIIYTEYDIDTDSPGNKDHYHLREKAFKLKGVNETGFMILLYDETQVYTLLRELNRLSNYDSMTGLHNRNYLEQKLSHFETTKKLGVISLDLNGLKINNDYLGHERGDFLLKALASKMKLIFSDITKKEMARIGGDEFIIITHEMSYEALKQKVQALLNECHHDDIYHAISVSIGIAYDDTGEHNIFSLIQSADAQMYEMKFKESVRYKDKMLEYIQTQDKYIR